MQACAAIIYSRIPPVTFRVKQQDSKINLDCLRMDCFPFDKSVWSLDFQSTPGPFGIQLFVVDISKLSFASNIRSDNELFSKLEKEFWDFRVALVIMLRVFFLSLFLIISILPSPIRIDFCRIRSIELHEGKMKSAQSVNNKVIKIKSPALPSWKKIHVNRKKRCDEAHTETRNEIKPAVEHCTHLSERTHLFGLDLFSICLKLHIRFFFRAPGLFTPYSQSGDVRSVHVYWGFFPTPNTTYIWLLGFWYWFQHLYDIASDFGDFNESIQR